MKSFNDYLKETGEIGFIEQEVASIVQVSGLPGVKPEELVVFETGDIGQVVTLGKELIEVLVLGKNSLQVGMKVTRTNTMLEVPLGKELLGTIIDPLGKVISGKPFQSETSRPVNIIAPGIQKRKKITKSCETGVSLVDLVIPLGSGQRELVIGDRKTGKSVFLQQTILSQAIQGTVCIYAAVGKKKQDIRLVDAFFKKYGVSEKVIVIAASSEDPLSIIYLCPFTAMTIAEYFRDEGADVLLILDDLTTHAKFYREIALLARRFPGRNSYPGDIFFTHARLLERAGNFQTEHGIHAITCLPVVETVQGDLSGYIQTNLMSITDGHIYFDSDLFSKGKRPAINPFLSVTRVGHQTQSGLRQTLDREIMSFLTLFEKLQSFVHFGTELGESLKTTLNTGENIYRFFDQEFHSVIPINVQIVLFSLLWNGIWKDKTTEEMRKDMRTFTTKYLTDKKVRSSIDEATLKANTFNDLLNIITKNGATYAALLELPGAVEAAKQTVTQTAGVSPVPGQTATGEKKT